MGAKPAYRSISPSALLTSLRNLRGECAVLDVREEGRFGHGHILLASSLPLSRLELEIEMLVPRHATPIVLCDDNDGLAQIAADLLGGLGYTGIALLAGGVAAWKAAGYELFGGLSVQSKVLGVFAHRQFRIPEIGADDLAALQAAGMKLKIVDCRPFAEYSRGSIPGSINCPGVELLGHLSHLGAGPDSKLVVHCAGRTRGLLATQMLIEAAIPGGALALHGGTMGWELSGRPLEKNPSRRLNGRPSESRERAMAAAESIRRRAGIPLIGIDILNGWRAEASRTTYLFDIRTKSEFEAGHIAGARAIAGGQLIQNIDRHAATRGARIVLSDDDGARATGAALWLRRMGWIDISIVLANENAGELETGPESAFTVNIPPYTDYMGVSDLEALLAGKNVLLVDLATSRTYRDGHIPGAWFAVRSRLASILASLPASETLVLTSEDGIQAAFAAAGVAAFDGAVRVLDGGTNAWQKAGKPMSRALDRLAAQEDDIVVKPSELREGREAAMREYLSGSEGLLEKAARDGTLHLTALPVIEERCA